MRTRAVAKRTTLLLVRFRLHLTLPPRSNTADPRTMVAEESRVIGFRGAPATPEWLSDGEVTGVLHAVPSGNIAPDQATAVLERVIDGLPGIDAHIDQVGDQLAERLRAAHIRVREAVGQRARRQIAVAAQRPGDLLGVYVYLPDVSA
jgi:hypothetical protein